MRPPFSRRTSYDPVVAGRDDRDLYGAAPHRSVGRTVARILGVLVGAGLSLYGVALFALRCFDTCPADPAVDKSTQLLSGALVLFGVVVVVVSAASGTVCSAGAAVFAVVLGVAIALAGLVSLVLVTSLASVVALLAGVIVAAAALLALLGLKRPPD